MRLHRLAGLLILLLAVGACSGHQLDREVQLSEQMGDWDAAVLQYLELVAKEPGNLTYRAGLLRAKIQASHMHFETAKQYRDAGVLERSLVELQEAVQLDPTNQYAFVELRKVRAELEAAREEREYVTSLDAVKEKTRGALALPPVLNPRSDEPIDLDFPEPVSVMSIYRALGKAFGINVLFDPKMRDEEISIQLDDVTAQDALEILIRTAGHFYKVLDPHSIIIVPDTTQNRRAYTDLLIQTFFLSNSEVNDVMTMLRTLIDSRKIAANERLNAISLRDSADKVKVAERLIQSNDKARAEVVVDVELMQIDTNKLREVGLSLEPRQISFSLDDGPAAPADGGAFSPADGGGGGIRFSDLEFLDSSSWFVTIPTFLIDFVKDSTEAQTLARPQLRISEGEKGSVVIADQVPIPVTSFNTANTIGGNIVPLTSFQYQDVGITIEIEPRVHHNNEISLVVRVEVSNIAGNIGRQPIIGTREINTTIRLRDGETNFLAGLIRTDESVTEEGIAGLSEIPLLGRLFTKKGTQNKRTDIVLTLTPHIIRRADITEEDLLPIWVGTETNFSFSGGGPSVESPSDGPFDEEDREEALERRRERLNRLPDGLRNRQREEEGDAPGRPASGIELAPSSAPTPVPPSSAELSPGVPGVGDPSETFAPLSSPEVTEVFAVASSQQSDREPPQPIVSVTLDPPGAVLLLGEIFETAVRVSAAAELSHLPMTLSYDPALLELVETREGAFLGDAGRAQILVDSSRSGVLEVGASRLGSVAGVTGTGTLLRLRFRAVGIGEGAVDVQKVRALDPGLVAVSPLRVTGSRVVVSGPLGTDPRLLEEALPASRSTPDLDEP